MILFSPPESAAENIIIVIFISNDENCLIDKIKLCNEVCQTKLPGGFFIGGRGISGIHTVCVNPH